MSKTISNIFYMLTEVEVDMINVLIHIIEKHNHIIPSEQPENNLNRCIITNMHEISASLGYKELDIQTITNTLDLLSKNIATIYYDDDNGRYMERSAFVNKYSISSTRAEINKRITLWLCSSIIELFIADKSMFDLHYKYAEHKLRSKYSKILYRKFYTSPKTVKVYTLPELTDLLDYDLVEVEYEWSRLNSNILKRAVKEINENSDMVISYNKLKSKSNNRSKTTEIEFSVFVTTISKIQGYYTSEDLISRQIDYFIEKQVNLIMARQLSFKTKDVIKDPEAYKHKLRVKEMNQRDEYEAKIIIQDWSNDLKYKNTDFYGLVVLWNYDGHEYVTINNDYKLFDLDTQTELSTSARDTREKLSKFLKVDKGTSTIYQPNKYYKNCSISYTER